VRCGAAIPSQCFLADVGAPTRVSCNSHLLIVKLPVVLSASDVRWFYAWKLLFALDKPYSGSAVPHRPSATAY
jgi:hypothetical protein